MMPGDIFVYHNWVRGAVASDWEARDAVKWLTGHRTALTAKSYPAPYVNSAEVQKPCCRWMKV